MAAIFVVIAVGLLALGGVTRGFAAVTADGVRRVDLERAPRSLPALPMIDQAGKAWSLADYGGASPYTTFVTLVYTRCFTICRTSASGLAFLQQEIQSRGLEDRVRLLTLSFDPFNDTPAVLAEYAKGLGADGSLWRTATVAHETDLETMLSVFDIVVIPDGLAGYSHNAALFRIDERGKLIKAYDIDRPDLALADYLYNKAER
ncbi:SCO family protein [Candidimonas sp. SYP-B2681]|nr:SCO family protein [Candidimonas sp. SYP-B2681]